MSVVCFKKFCGRCPCSCKCQNNAFDKAIKQKFIYYEADLPYEEDDGNVHMKAIMKIRLQKKYKPDRFTFRR